MCRQSSLLYAEASLRVDTGSVPVVGSVLRQLLGFEEALAPKSQLPKALHHFIVKARAAGLLMVFQQSGA